MKKTAVILLLLIYGASTMGTTIHLHYCMNQLIGWSLWHGETDKNCEKCGMKEKKGGCCKDEHKQVKLKSEHNRIASVQSIQNIDVRAIATPFTDLVYKSPTISLSFPVSEDPPKIPNERLYMLHCAFLI